MHLAQTSESDVLSEPCGYSLGNSSSTTSMIGLRIMIRVPTRQLESLHEPSQRSHSAFLSKLLLSEGVHLHPCPTFEPSATRNVSLCNSGYSYSMVSDSRHDTRRVNIRRQGIAASFHTPGLTPDSFPALCTGAFFGTDKVEHHWCRSKMMLAEQHIKRYV